MANSVDLDETARYEPSHHYLPTLFAQGSVLICLAERIKFVFYSTVLCQTFYFVYFYKSVPYLPYIFKKTIFNKQCRPRQTLQNAASDQE